MIENTTGLPELPEGQFWRIEKSPPSAYFGPSYKYQLCIMEYVPYPLIIEISNPEYRWWNFAPKTIRRASTNEDGVKKIECSGISHWIRDDEISGQDLQELKKAEKRYYRSGLDKSSYISHPRSSNELTSLNIRRTAERMIAGRAEKARVAGLLGDYPPKSLPAGDSDD